MKYFLIKTDPQFHNIPKIRDWFEKVDRRNIRMGESYKIENRQLFFVENNPQIVFPDVLSFPFFMVTEVLRDVILAYEPKTIFKEIVLLEQDNAKTCTYFMPILDYIDCLAPASTLTRDRSTIIDAVLDLGRLNGHSIFCVALLQFLPCNGGITVKIGGATIVGRFSQVFSRKRECR